MTEERIITAAVVTTGEKGDGPELLRLLKISQQNGLDVETMAFKYGNAGRNGHLYCKLKKNPEIDLKRRNIASKTT